MKQNDNKGSLDATKIENEFNRFFTQIAAQFSRDTYLILQDSLDQLDISSPPGKAVFFACDVSATQRKNFFDKHPDHICLWSTKAGIA